MEQEKNKNKFLIIGIIYIKKIIIDIIIITIIIKCLILWIGQ